MTPARDAEGTTSSGLASGIASNRSVVRRAESKSHRSCCAYAMSVRISARSAGGLSIRSINASSSAAIATPSKMRPSVTTRDVSLPDIPTASGSQSWDRVVSSRSSSKHWWLSAATSQAVAVNCARGAIRFASDTTPSRGSRSAILRARSQHARAAAMSRCLSQLPALMYHIRAVSADQRPLGGER